jgi:hypothetical protein
VPLVGTLFFIYHNIGTALWFVPVVPEKSLICSAPKKFQKKDTFEAVSR